MANTKPQANITVNKGRTKVKEGKVYLKEGTEFEIELFNPTTTNVLAKISIDGTEISQGGLIVKPGQRYFLERFLDIAKKFKFETYEVSGRNMEVAAAIAQNGLVEISFYKEQKPKPIIRVNTTQPYNVNGTYYNTGTSIGAYVNGTLTNTTLNTTLGDNVLRTSSLSTTGLFDATAVYNASMAQYTNSVSLDSLDMGSFKTTSISTPASEKTIETGRVEKGSSSSQKFDEVHMDFERFTIANYTYQLLPTSREVVNAESITNYCSECGCKIKGKFCHNCGTKA